MSRLPVYNNEQVKNRPSVALGVTLTGNRMLHAHTAEKEITRWLYCVECSQYSTRLEALGYLCDCVSRRVQR